MKTNVCLSRKRLGEWAEVCFMQKVLSLGLSSAKPFGDSDRFDQAVFSGPKVSRVQVRSTRQFRDNRYELCVQHTRGHYTLADADFIAAYVIPLDVWYIIPIAAITSHTKIHLAPHRPSRGRAELFREAWHLLM